MKIIDAHLHYFVGEDYERSRYSDPEILFAGGIEQAWILSARKYKMHHASDAQVLELCNRYPGRLHGFGFIDFEQSPDNIDRQLEAGFVGLKTIWPPHPYDDQRLFDHYARAEQLGMPVMFHCGGAYHEPHAAERFRAAGQKLTPEVECLLGRNMLPIHFDAIAKCFPDLVIIMAHLGGDLAYMDQAALICAGHNGQGRTRMYMDVSSSLCTRWPSLVKFRDVLSLVGPDALLFGTDLSFTHAVRNACFWQVLLSQSLNLPPPDVERMMGLNADQIIQQAYDRLGRGHRMI